MSKKMTSAEHFNAIDIALRNLEGVIDAIRNIQNVEISKLFHRAQKWESLEHQIIILEAGIGAGGEGISNALQVNDWLVAIKTN